MKTQSGGNMHSSTVTPELLNDDEYVNECLQIDCGNTAGSMQRNPDSILLDRIRRIIRVWTSNG
jgi:hypothetical protein